MNLFYSKYQNFLISKTALICILIGWGLSLNSQVSVTATAGTATATYSNLSIAFDSINKGRHKGAIVLNLTANISQPTAPVSLRESGVSLGPVSSSYSSVLIIPTGNIVVSGNPNPNRALIELFGADNVTIDGDDPSTAGDKNLSFVLGTTGTATAAVHIGSNSVPTVDGADNNKIKNCIILGARSNNVNLTNTFGIVVSSNSITTITSAGQSNTGTLIENDSISRALFGIVVLGQDGFPMNNTIIRNNKIGVTTNVNNNIGQYGILINGTSETVANGAIIEGNEIVVGLDNTSGYGADCVGILTWDNTVGTIIRYNNIHDIINTTTSTTNYCAGIQLDGFWQAGNMDINNNIIRDVIGRKKSTADGLCDGIQITGDVVSNLKINYNTIALIRGNTVGTTANHSNSNVAFLSTTGTTNLLEFNNNILYNANIGTGTRGLIIDNPAVNIGGASMDKNCYYIPNGTYGANNLFYYTTLNAWQLSNLKEMQSFVEKPNFISNTDLHIKPNVVTKLESNAAFVVSNFDIDKEARPMAPATVPDIGADEFLGIPQVPSRIIFVGHSPSTSLCSAVDRSITANIVKGNSDTAVYLSYRYNNGAFTNVKMTNTTGNFYSGTIPATFPSYNLVTYRVFLIDSLKGDTVSSNYNYFNDLKTEGAYAPVFTSNPMQACVGSTVTLSYSIPTNPTLFNAPPTVTTPTFLADIDSVAVGTLVNVSSLNVLNGSIGTPTGTAGSYSNYRALRTDSFEIAKSYPMYISTASNGLAKNYISAYIDLNGDGDFADADENIGKTLYVDAIGGRTERFNLFIPRASKPGKTVLRIITSTSQVTSPTSPIENGETEDYSIYIKPLVYQWVVNGVDAVTTNPYSLTIATLPTTVTLKIKDTSVTPACESSLAPISITASPASMSVSLLGSSVGCINEVRKLFATISGGCAPYTYSWSNGATTSSSDVSLVATGVNAYSVTVTDKNNLTATATISITASNPQPIAGTIKPGQVICNRGSAILSGQDILKNTLYWFNTPSTNPFSPDYIGDSFTTPLLSQTTTFYVSAVRNTLDSSGRLNIGTTTANYASFLGVDNGLTFTTTQPITITRCALYGTGTGVTLNIGIKDRSGTIIAQTGNISVTMAAAATTATLVPLSLSIPIPDSGYQMVLLSYTGLTTLYRNSAGHTYPISSTKPMIITGGINFGNYNHPNYYYFYNIRYTTNICVGLKNAVTAIVTPPRVPQVKVDLAYTQICKGSNIVFPVVSDTFGNIYEWFRRDTSIKTDTVPGSLPSFVPAKDSLKYSYTIYSSKDIDTGDYYAIISSSRFCTRDTFTRKIKVSFYPETQITSDLKALNVCLGTKTNFTIGTDIGKTFNWFKNGSIIAGNNFPVLNFDTVKFTDSGYYQVFVKDTFGCKSAVSDSVKLSVFNHPSILTKPLDSFTICEDGRITIKHQPNNYTDLQWYKDGGLVAYFTKDSFLIRNATVLDSGKYHLEAKSYPGCTSAYSVPTHLTVNPKPILNLNLFTARFCEGDKLTLAAKYKNAKRIEWYKDGSNTGVFADSFIVPISAVTDSGKYKFNIIGLDMCPNLFSNNIVVSIPKKPVVTGTIPNQLVCEDDVIKVAFNTNYVKTYKWVKNGVDIQSLTDSILYLKFVSILDTGKYKLKVNSDPVCKEIFSNSFSIAVTEKPKITEQPIGATLCLGTNYTLKGKAIKGVSYQWKRNGVNITSATDSVYIINSVGLANVGSYNLVITGKAPCNSVTSDTAKIIVKSGATNAYISEQSRYDAVEQCTDNNGWTYFAITGDEDKYLFAVRKNGNVFTSKADIIVRPNIFQSISNTKDGFNGTYMLRRMWNLELLTGSISSPIDVKFYISLNEQLDLEKKVQDLKNLHENSVNFVGSDLIWFKTPDTVPFTNQLLTLVRGNQLNFPYMELTTINQGKDGAIDYYQLENIESVGGGSAMKQFKGITKFQNSIVSINDNASVNLYPNPNVGVFDIEISTNVLKDINCTIYNAVGQKVYNDIIKQRSQTSNTHFVLEHLPSGNYNIVLDNEHILKSIKLQIVK